MRLSATTFTRYRVRQAVKGDIEQPHHRIMAKITDRVEACGGSAISVR
jgi:hypothetical protein